MKRPFILLTGDDSIRAEGLILVKRMIQDFADFQIIATKDQQSAKGSSMNFRGGEWGTEMVDGVEAIWVDGSPVDSVYFAFDYFEQKGIKPDLVISGMNTGENIADTVHTSGTLGAAMAACIQRATQTIAFSMQIKDANFLEHAFNPHTGDIREELLSYPGGLIKNIVKQALEVGMPSQTFWNVNFPAMPTQKIVLARHAYTHFFLNSQKITDSRFSYNFAINENVEEQNSCTYQLLEGNAVVTPIKPVWTNQGEYERLSKLEIFEGV